MMWGLGLYGCDESTGARSSTDDARVPDVGVASDAGPESGREAVVDAGEVAPAPSEALQACARQGEELGAPTTIAGTLARINAMPMPVTISCFVASLPRPLRIVATFSDFSAQPADGRASPRVFLISETLILSVVLDGVSKHLLEFGEFVSPTRTIKGEIAFPVTAPLAASVPYDDLLHQQNLTTCGLCHRTEEPHPTIEGAFISDAFRPEPWSEVPLQELLGYAATGCEEGSSRERCDMMQALFSLGPVEQGLFDEGVPRFLE